VELKWAEQVLPAAILLVVILLVGGGLAAHLHFDGQLDRVDRQVPQAVESHVGQLEAGHGIREVHGIGQAPLSHKGGVDEAGREAVTVPHPIDDLLGLVGGQLEVLALRGHAAGSQAAPGHNDAGSSDPDVSGHPQQLVDSFAGLQRRHPAPRLGYILGHEDVIAHSNQIHNRFEGIVDLQRDHYAILLLPPVVVVEDQADHVAGFPGTARLEVHPTVLIQIQFPEVLRLRLILGSKNLYRVCYYKVYQDIQTDKPQKKGGQILCCHFGLSKDQSKLNLFLNQFLVR